MTEETIYDLTIARLADGGVELSQNIGCGDTATLTLHRCHLRHLFEQLGYVKSAAPDTLARRFAEELYDTLDELRKCRIDEEEQLHLLMRLRWFVDEIVWPTGFLDDYVNDETDEETKIEDELPTTATQGALL